MPSKFPCLGQKKLKYNATYPYSNGFLPSFIKLRSHKYEEDTDEDSCITTGLTSAITAGIEAKQQKLITAFTKYHLIANPANGAQFLSKVQFYNPFKLTQISMYLKI